MSEITSGLTGNNEEDAKYLINQAEKYKNTEFSLEISRAIGRIMYDIIPEELKKNIDKISNNNSLGIDKTLEEANFQIFKKDFKKGLKIIEGLIKNIEELGWYKDDNISEYHSFNNMFEEIIYKETFKPIKEIRQIPENYAMVYFTYGSLLVELKDYEKAKTALEKANRYNPVSTLILFELAELHKLNKNWFEYLNLNKKCLEFAYSSQSLARCYRNYGYYFIEQQNYILAINVYFLSLNFDQENKMAQSQLLYISQKTGLSIQKPKENDITELLNNNDVQIGANPLILAIAHYIAKDAFANKNLEICQYYSEILFDLTKDENFKDIVSKIISSKFIPKEKGKNNKKNETKQKLLPKLTEEELQEYRSLLEKEMSIEWCKIHLDKEIEIMRKRTAKEQHTRLNHQRKNKKNTL